MFLRPIGVIFVAEILFVFCEETPLVTLPKLGKIQGDCRKSLDGQNFYTFEGVPYARAPTGQLRFKEPASVQPWSGVKEAKTIYRCIQYNQYTPPGEDYVIGDEDCLYLNIYTPSLNPNASLDVIVYIHGGAFMFNFGGLHGPEYLLDKPVVYINFNYRVGPLGFLSTENREVPGNNGLRDQIKALEFIQQYVKYFGGNKNSVTLLGMSAGGASVHFHYLCPQSSCLFTRGISQSGTMLNHWALAEKSLEKAKQLAAGLNCSTSNSSRMIGCLRKRSAREIVASVKNFQPWLYNPFAPFGPVVDSWAAEPLLSDHPYNLIKNQKVYDAPWIVSYTNSEGLYPAADFLIDEQYLTDIDTQWNKLVPFILDYNYTVEPELRDLVSQKIREHYLKDKKVSRDTFRDFFSISSDRSFFVDIQKAAMLQASVTTSPVYSYYFTYRGAHSWSEYRSGSNEDFGASHGDDMAYVLKIDDVDTTSTENDRCMVKLMVDMVTSYAKTGEPKIKIKWPTVSKRLTDTFTYLQIDSSEDLSVGRGVSSNTEFWNSLPILENEKLLQKN